jgi:hypothetical protein
MNIIKEVTFKLYQIRSQQSFHENWILWRIAIYSVEKISAYGHIESHIFSNGQMAYLY